MCVYTYIYIYIYLLRWLSDKESSLPLPPKSSGDLGLIPGSGRCPRGGNGSPFQNSCRENLMDRGPWWAAVRGVADSWAQVSGKAPTHIHKTPNLADFSDGIK